MWETKAHRISLTTKKGGRGDIKGKKKRTLKTDLNSLGLPKRFLRETNEQTKGGEGEKEGPAGKVVTVRITGCSAGRCRCRQRENRRSARLYRVVVPLKEGTQRREAGSLLSLRKKIDKKREEREPERLEEAFSSSSQWEEKGENKKKGGGGGWGRRGLLSATDVEGEKKKKAIRVGDVLRTEDKRGKNLEGKRCKNGSRSRHEI